MRADERPLPSAMTTSARLCAPPRSQRTPQPMLHRASPRIAAVAVMFLAACGGGGDSTAPCAVSAVTVSPTTAGIRVGATSQLSASVTAQNCSATPSVAWSTGDAGVATVSSSGLVTAVAAGTTTISATAQSMQSGSVITVTLIPVQSVVVTAPSTSMSVGATSQAVAAVRDTTARDGHSSAHLDHLCGGRCNGQCCRTCHRRWPWRRNDHRISRRSRWITCVHGCCCRVIGDHLAHTRTCSSSAPRAVPMPVLLHATPVVRR
jgi:hypothetical protein